MEGHRIAKVKIEKMENVENKAEPQSSRETEERASGFGFRAADKTFFVGGVCLICHPESRVLCGPQDRCPSVVLRAIC
jgi:hypothetical protein